MPTRIKAALYARFSTDHQRTESIDAQIRAMKKYCAEKRWRVVAIYTDEGVSATTDRRQAFQKMIADSANGTFNAVLVHKLDRFSRNRYDSAVYKRHLKKNGVQLYSVLERLDDTPESIILEALLEGMAEYYSRNLSREVMKGLLENAYKCKHNGGLPPLGYDLDADGRLIINEKEAECVRMIYQLYLDGYNRQVIADQINEKGFCTKRGNPFTKYSFREILSNVKYTGVYLYNRTEAKDFDRKRNSHKHKTDSEIVRVVGGCPAIISKEQFLEVFLRKQQYNKKGAVNHANNFYLCSGIIRCGVCGKSMSGFERKYKQSVFVYTCVNKQAVCDNTKEIDRDKLDAFAVEILGKEMMNPAKAVERIVAVNAAINHYNEEYPHTQDQIIHKLQSVTKRLEKLNNNPEAEDSLIDRLESEQEQLKQQLENLHKLSLLPINALDDAITKYQTLPKDDVRFLTLLQKYILEIRVHKTRVTFVLNTGLGVLNGMTKAVTVRRNRFLTRAQEKRLQQFDALSR